MDYEAISMFLASVLIGLGLFISGFFAGKNNVEARYNELFKGVGIKTIKRCTYETVTESRNWYEIVWCDESKNNKNIEK